MIQLSNVVPIKDGTEVPQTQNLKIGCAATESIGVENDTCIDISENCFSPDLDEECFQHEDKDRQGKVISNCLTLDFPSASLTISEKPQDAANVITLSTAKVVKKKKSNLFQCYSNMDKTKLK